MKLLKDFHCEQNRHQSYKDHVLYDDDIDRTQMKTTASGGIEVVLYHEDEYGNETRHRIILERIDLMMLEDMKNKKLL